MFPSNTEETALYRILDANLDRAREGLRIIEEWCRFGLNQATWAETCKSLRQELAQWHKPEIWAARDTPNDLGTHLSHPQEESRSSIAQVLRVNFCRTQEALRVLEEYGKLYSPQMGESCKQMRYQVYTLESHLLGNDRLQKLQQAHLYLVTAPVTDLFSTVEAALQGGLKLLQYRDKLTDDAIRFENARKLKQLCQQYQALFIVNDRVDLAIAVDADGVHLGQQDMPIATARQLLGSQRIIGRSTTNPNEMQRAIQEGADYIGVGPVYATPTKEGKAATGLDYVRYAVTHATVPWFAIGGIDAENLPDVLAAGAQRVAVVRAIMQAEQPTLATRGLRSRLLGSRE
ncbi:MAG: thiamine phosphate synthase [Oculatellaceae cyanobacterium Prado106]|jgi:thiamine-phosphate pyrophosphorylase|nr:thiamine phosphate synthase [Oculatellaceae cyanobacterium Prado106]